MFQVDVFALGYIHGFAFIALVDHFNLIFTTEFLYKLQK